jgi:hypothetical protein
VGQDGESWTGDGGLRILCVTVELEGVTGKLEGFTGELKGVTGELEGVTGDWRVLLGIGGSY